MPKSQKPIALIENKLLAALSTKCYKRLAPHLEPVSLTLRDVLYKPQEHIQYIYFPHKSIISLINILKDRSMVEMALIGPEGMLGCALLSGDDVSPHQAIVQGADVGVRLKAKVFREHLKQDSEFHNMMQRYSQALFFQVAQTAACNSLHPIVKRFARWLLLTQDIIESETLELTHELIATMLSVQRSGVTLAAGTLQKAGIIKYSRGKVTILKRKELEEVSCECYKTIKAEFSRLLDKYNKN